MIHGISKIRTTGLGVVLIAALCYSTRVQSQALANPYPPSGYPDRIVLNVTEDPSRSLAVNWRTHDSISTGTAEIMIATSNPAEAVNAVKTKAVTETVTHLGIVANYHSVVFKDLLPGTQYMYRVGSGGFWSEWFHVKTTESRNEPFSFIFMGDVQQGMRTFWPRVIREAYKKMPDAKLIMYAGDIVNKGRNDHEWGELFYGGSFIHSTIPGMMSPGNHEHADNEQGVNELTALWRPQFTLPENGPEGLEETCYYADIQGVRFISLNSQAIWFGGEGMQKQIDWLEKILSDNPNKWTCVIFHHTVYPVMAGRDNINLRSNFQPIFNKYRVDLVLQGHDHAYGRGMHKIPMPDSKGTSPAMYAVSMSGSKMYSLKEEPKWADKSGAQLQLYQLITIHGDKLSYRSYTATGDLFDAFDLKKRKNKPNKLIDLN